MKSKEYILCSAIRRVTPREETCNYYENDISLVELGYRHHDILIRFRGVVSKDPKDQGFYTSLGRFVSRTDAFLIAKEAGQIETSECTGTLFSEDLY